MIDTGDNAVKSLPPNLYHIDYCPAWMEFDGLLAYIRTSSSQNDTPGDGQYQLQAVTEAARERGLAVHTTFADIGKDGYSIGESRPEFRRAIEIAAETGLPIVAFDPSRFCHEPHKLARFPDVAFVTLAPLDTNPPELPGIRKRAANKYNPAGRGGRPRDREANLALPFIMAHPLLGRWKRIAEELGDGWTDKKVSRVFRRHFTYIDALK